MNYFNKKGFSLIETLIVAALIGILSAIAVPMLIQWSSNLMYKEAAWGITSQSRLAKQMALANNLECRVELDINGKRYRLTQGNLPFNSTAWTVIKGWTGLESQVKWATGALCDGNANINIGFRPNGSADSGVICVEDSGNVLKYRVTINPTTGRVYIN